MNKAKLFIVIVKYIAPIEEVEKHLDAHSAYLQQYYDHDVFLASGRQVPRFGGIILAKANSRQNLYDILAEDPFYQNLCAEYQVHEFAANRSIPSFESFLKDVGINAE